MIYRFLDPEEFYKLDKVFDKYGWSELHPVYSKVLVAEENEEIVGFLCLQTVLHTEPLYVQPKKRGGEITKELVSRMTKFLSENNVNCYFCHSDNPFVVSICKENNMKEVRAFKKE